MMWISVGDKNLTAIASIYWRGQNNEEAREINTQIANKMVEYTIWCQMKNINIIWTGDFNG